MYSAIKLHIELWQFFPITNLTNISIHKFFYFYNFSKYFCNFFIKALSFILDTQSFCSNGNSVIIKILFSNHLFSDHLMLEYKILFFFFFSFIFISWRLITSQHCSGFLSYIDMNQSWSYLYSPSGCPLPPPSPPDSSGSSQCTRSEHLSHASNLGWLSVSL